MIKIASVNIFTRIKRRLIDNWIDETSNTLYDFSPWRNKSFWGNINNTLETNETIFSAVTR
ncbi:MAG: phage portal protein, partial [Staphylococcus epidermidis]|nr:phage portal protein [Staphylococcus epidermidis]